MRVTENPCNDAWEKIFNNYKERGQFLKEWRKFFHDKRWKNGKDEWICLSERYKTGSRGELQPTIALFMVGLVPQKLTILEDPVEWAKTATKGPDQIFDLPPRKGQTLKRRCFSEVKMLLASSLTYDRCGDNVLPRYEGIGRYAYDPTTDEWFEAYLILFIYTKAIHRPAYELLHENNILVILMPPTWDIDDILNGSRELAETIRDLLDIEEYLVTDNRTSYMVKGIIECGYVDLPYEDACFDSFLPIGGVLDCPFEA